MPVPLPIAARRALHRVTASVSRDYEPPRVSQGRLVIWQELRSGKSPLPLFSRGLGNSNELAIFTVMLANFHFRGWRVFGDRFIRRVRAHSVSDKKLLLSASFLALSVLTLASLWSLDREQREQKKRVVNELTAIAELKVQQVSAWHAEMLRDARVLMRTPHLARSIVALAADPQDSSLRADLTAWLEEMHRFGQYETVVLFDREMKPLLAVPPSANATDERLQELLQSAPAARDVLDTSFHRGPTGNVHADWLAPVFNEREPGIVGAVLLQVNPETLLLPMLGTWPVPKRTAETLLFSREGDEIVFVNERRHDATPALILRHSAKDPRILATKVARGEARAVEEASDYRGVPVLGVGRQIQGTRWFMLAKIDQVEAYAPLRELRSRVITVTVALACVVLLGTGLLWRQSNLDLLRREIAVGKEREELAQRLAVLMEQANDAIILMDDHGRILEANDRARRNYGYKLDEFRALPAGALHAPTEANLIAELNLFASPAGAVFEAVHQRKDGSPFWVEVSGRSFEITGRQFKLGVFRDISERKAGEREIQRLTQLYAALSRINKAIVHCHDRDQLFSRICRILVELGRFKMAWIGWHDDTVNLIRPVASFGDQTRFLNGVTIYADDRPECRGPVNSAFRDGRAIVCHDFRTDENTAGWRHRAAQHGFMAAIALPIRRDDKVTGVLAVYSGQRNTILRQDVELLEEAAQDVSFALDNLEREERRRMADAALRESEARYRSLFANLITGFAYCQMIYENGEPIDYIHVEVNDAFSQLTGLQNVTGRKVSEVIPGVGVLDRGLIERYGRVARSGAPERFETYLVALKMWFDIAVYCPKEGYFVAVFDVITARKEAAEALDFAHARLRRIVDSNIVGIVVGDGQGRIVEANEYYLSLIGFTREELQQGKIDWRALTPPDWLPVDEQAIREMREHGRCTPYEKEYLRRDGKRVPVFLADALLPGPEEQIAAFVLDLTERKHTEQQVANALSFKRALIDNLPVGVATWNEGGQCISVNESLARMVGGTTEQILAQNFRVLESWKEAGMLRAAEAALETGIEQSLETHLASTFGKDVWVFCRFVPFGHDDKRHLLLVIADVTERRKAEEQLRLLNTAMLAAPNCVTITDAEGAIEWINPAFTRLTGYSSEEVVGKNPRLLKSGQQSPDFYADLWRTIRSGRSWRGEFVNKRKDGSFYTEDATIAPVRDPAGTIRHFVAIKQDVTARKEADRRLREHAEALDKANEAIVIGDLHGRITFWSRGAERLFGWNAEEMIGKAHDVFANGHAASHGAFHAISTTVNDWQGEIQTNDREGNALDLQTSVTVLRDERGRPTGRLSISTDITEKKKLAEQALRSQRVESIGMLAAGIAHDLNNVLAPVCMASSLLRPNLADADSLQILETLDKCADRGARLVRQILGFARGAGGEPQTVMVKHLLRDIIEVIGETFPKSIILDARIPNDLWAINANPTQIHQVLLNLCVNARDAMPNGGTLCLAAENCDLDAEAARLIAGAQPGAWLVLHVEDTGTGVPPDVLAKIWQPFFTTKSANKGTGLGLSTVRGIVETHHGFVSLRTDVGRGTTFRVYLPAFATRPASDIDADAAAIPRGNNEHILLVEDEKLIRETANVILSNGGYRVTATANGSEAAAEFLARAAEFAVVITDRDMPRMNGSDLAHLVRAHHSATPILAMSGIGSEQIDGDGQREKFGDAFLQKPFTAESLLKSVAQLLRPNSSPSESSA